MKYRIPTTIALAGALAAAPIAAEEDPKATPEDIVQVLAKHQAGSDKLADDQDELSADVQELIEEQTSDKVIELLDEVETIMGEVIDNLDDHDTGGGTIAAETEVIEKIFEAAKKRAQERQEQKEQQEGEQEQQEGEPQPGGG